MLYEFALDPQVVFQITDTRRNFSDFQKSFSIGTPAVISDFPKMKDFRKQVLIALADDMPESQKLMVVETLKFLSESPRVKRCTEYNQKLDWRSNVVSENERIPFDVVVCSDAEMNIGEISLDDMHEGYPEYPRQVLVNRVTLEMTKAIQNMLRISSKIVFVDPYFSTEDKNWNPFVNFIQAAKTRQPVSSIEVEMLFRKGVRGITLDLVNKFKAEHADLLEGCSVTFKQIKERHAQQNIHNRYVLTDIGGVCFGVGLGEEGFYSTDEISLLEKPIYNLRYNQYVRLDEFDVCEENSCGS